jgi:hypothetical protein
MCGFGIGVPKSTALGVMTPAPGSSGIVGPGVSRLVLSGSPGFAPPPNNWRRVEDNMEFACSQVIDAERLLHETLALVGRNILRLIRVSLKQERKVCLCASGFIRAFSLPLVFVSIVLVPG